MKFQNIFHYLGVLGAILMPFAVGAAVSSTSFQLEAEDFSTGKSVTSATNGYVLEAQFDYLAGNVSSTSFVLDAGSSASRFYCGDGFRDVGETCDGTDLQSVTCASQGFASGSISCSSACALVTTSCNAASSGGGGGGGGGGGSASTTTTPAAPSVSTTISGKTFSYKSTFLLFGSKESTVTSVTVNGSETGLTYPTTTTWQATVTLVYGTNTYKVVAKNSSGSSTETTYTLLRRLIGDVVNDNVINDYDLSRIAKVWGTTDTAADFNEDGTVNDYDFSMMVARWGTKV